MIFDPTISCRAEAIGVFRDIEQLQNQRKDVRDWFVKRRQHDLDPAWSRLNFVVEAQSRIVYMNPLFECGAASYNDAKRILYAIHRELAILNEVDACVVCGDGQTYKMILNILRSHKTTGTYK